MMIILALVAAVVLGGLSQAFASEVLFTFGPPTQNINGYPFADYPDRGNGVPSPQEWAAGTTPAPTIADTNYRIVGDNFTIGTTGQQYHIDKITVYMLWGAATSATDTFTPFNPQDTGVPLQLLVGQPGNLNTAASSFTSTRVYYPNGENYQRLLDGVWRRVWQINFDTDLTIEGGQEYYFFVNGILGSPQSGYSTPSLAGANKTLGNVTDIVGSYDNNFYWYNKADGSIEAGSAFLPENFNNLTGDLHVTITGSQVPIPGSLLLLGSGLMGLGAAGWRRRV